MFPLLSKLLAVYHQLDRIIAEARIRLQIIADISNKSFIVKLDAILEIIVHPGRREIRRRHQSTTAVSHVNFGMQAWQINDDARLNPFAENVERLNIQRTTED